MFRLVPPLGCGPARTGCDTSPTLCASFCWLRQLLAQTSRGEPGGTADRARQAEGGSIGSFEPEHHLRAPAVTWVHHRGTFPALSKGELPPADIWLAGERAPTFLAALALSC